MAGVTEAVQDKLHANLELDDVVAAKQSALAAKKGIPAIDETGKTIRHTARWGFDHRAFASTELKSFTFDVLFVSSFLAFNASDAGHRFYAYLDANYTPFEVNAWGTFLITTVAYWVWAGFYAFLDLTGKPAFMFRYKVQPFQRVGAREYGKIALVALRNQFLVVLPLAIGKAYLTPSPITPSKMESPAVALLHIVFNVFCTEVGFYFIHRAFHSKALYARYHKQHHDFTAPVGLAATYCSIPEHIFSNLLPNTIGTSILRPHWSVSTFTFLFLSIETVSAHSGYNFPFLHSSLRHDWHHFAFTENFGPTGLFDSLLGTSKRYDAALQDGEARCQGDTHAAREDLLRKLASWEQEQQGER